MHCAGLDRLRSVNEILGAHSRAVRGGKLTGVGIDLRADDAGGRCELRHVAILPMLWARLMNSAQTGSADLAPSRFKLAIVVEAHPHHADQLAR